MNRRFPILGTLAAMAALGSGQLVARTMPTAPEVDGYVVGLRLMAGLVAILSLVAAEALWWPRHWVLRAVDALGLACTASPAVFLALGTGFRDWQLVGATAAGSALLIGLPYLVVRQHVRVRAQRLGLIPPPPRPTLRGAP